ncbi:MAG: hypothetical protein LBU32_32280 [Clostridiales bacterium]|jgi:hypothetical protein|nr:hypothetical protein [Clostridiales bacterium]
MFSIIGKTGASVRKTLLVFSFIAITASAASAAGESGKPSSLGLKEPDIKLSEGFPSLSVNILEPNDEYLSWEIHFSLGPNPEQWDRIVIGELIEEPARKEAIRWTLVDENGGIWPVTTPSGLKMSWLAPDAAGWSMNAGEMDFSTIKDKNLTIKLTALKDQAPKEGESSEGMLGGTFINCYSKNILTHRNVSYAGSKSSSASTDFHPLEDAPTEPDGGVLTVPENEMADFSASSSLEYEPLEEKGSKISGTERNEGKLAPQGEACPEGGQFTADNAIFDDPPPADNAEDLIDDPLNGEFRDYKIAEESKNLKALEEEGRDFIQATPEPFAGRAAPPKEREASAPDVERRAVAGGASEYQGKSAEYKPYSNPASFIDLKNPEPLMEIGALQTAKPAGMTGSGFSYNAFEKGEKEAGKRSFEEEAPTGSSINLQIIKSGEPQAGEAVLDTNTETVTYRIKAAFGDLGSCKVISITDELDESMERIGMDFINTDLDDWQILDDCGTVTLNSLLNAKSLEGKDIIIDIHARLKRKMDISGVAGGAFGREPGRALLNRAKMRLVSPSGDAREIKAETAYLYTAYLPSSRLPREIPEIRQTVAGESEAVFESRPDSFIYRIEMDFRDVSWMDRVRIVDRFDPELFETLYVHQVSFKDDGHLASKPSVDLDEHGFSFNLDRENLKRLKNRTFAFLVRCSFKPSMEDDEIAGVLASSNRNSVSAFFESEEGDGLKSVSETRISMNIYEKGASSFQSALEDVRFRAESESSAQGSQERRLERFDSGTSAYESEPAVFASPEMEEMRRRHAELEAMDEDDEAEESGETYAEAGFAAPSGMRVRAAQEAQAGGMDDVAIQPETAGEDGESPPEADMEIRGFPSAVDDEPEFSSNSRENEGRFSEASRETQRHCVRAEVEMQDYSLAEEG